MQQWIRLRRAILALAACGISFSVTTPAAHGQACDPARPAMHHELKATADTVHWGYFSKTLKPRITVRSGDLVTVETVTHHAGDDFARMIKGDPGVEAIFKWTKDGKGVNRRGAGPVEANIMGRGAGEGFGVHVLTGPIAVCGAEPGDILEVRILKTWPRPSGNPEYAGKTFGSNAAAWWGYLYNFQITEPKKREVITIYELDATGEIPYAKAVYSYQWVPQTDPFGVVHKIIDYPGVIVDHALVKKDNDVMKHVRVPLRIHFGTMGVAPKEADFVDSIPPSYFGGNIDNWRIGEGGTMYYPVALKDALLSLGDPHAAQGDSELAGTAVETSITGILQVILHKSGTLKGTVLQGLDFPLLETKSEYVVHGFTYSNYLGALGEKAQSDIYSKSATDPALKDAVAKMRAFLMNAKGLTEDEAISLMSVAVDFGVTQVVDGSWGVHGIVPKGIFMD